MGQLGFFDVNERYKKLDEKDPLIVLSEGIPWEKFRGKLMKALSKERRSEAGRRPFDYVMMFKILVLQSLYSLSDAQVEHQIRDRFTFMRFLGLGAEDRVPDEKTVWLFREALKEVGAVESLFSEFEKYLEKQGFSARKGMILDATIVEVPIQRNSSDENQAIKKGESPSEWTEEKRAQKDIDARWTKSWGGSYFGYKNHVNVDHSHKLIRKYEITPASTCENKVVRQLLDGSNTNKTVWADSIYDTKNIQGLLEKNGYRNCIQRQPRSCGLTIREHERNARFSKVRKKVEHVFGFQTNSMNAMRIKTVGIARATVKIGFNNLVYNIMRYLQLERIKHA